MKIATPRLKGVLRISASRDTATEPAINGSAPISGPPSDLGASGRQTVVNKKFVIDTPSFIKVDKPFEVMKKIIEIVVTIRRLAHKNVKFLPSLFTSFWLAIYMSPSKFYSIKIIASLRLNHVKKLLSLCKVCVNLGAAGFIPLSENFSPNSVSFPYKSPGF
jgi:hypothetical protein